MPELTYWAGKLFFALVSAMASLCVFLFGVIFTFGVWKWMELVNQ
jgi:hypothetical protein